MSTGSIFFSQSGGNSRLKTASSYSNLQLSGNFTIEFFMKCDSSVTSYPYPVILGPEGSSVEANEFYFHVSHAGFPGLIWIFNAAISEGTAGLSTTNVVDNQWHHVAAVRNGLSSNNVKLYVDGVLNSTKTSTAMWNFSNLVLGGDALYPDQPMNRWYKGYISNLRILNGTALYTSNFLVPTSNLTNITNTVLLLNMAYNSPYTDSSSFNRAMTTVGTPTPSTNSPFGTPLPCFKEDTKILILKNNSEQFAPVQDLRKGDLVKTLYNGYVPINMIGKKDIMHTSSGPRDKDKLYKCTQENYPEVIEDLVITGCHSILVEDFVNEQQREATIGVLGKIYVTDTKYRLPACLDERAAIYEKDGTYTIYHIALDNENYYANYGICANGLLVESCSKRYLKEIANMELI